MKNLHTNILKSTLVLALLLVAFAGNAQTKPAEYKYGGENQIGAFLSKNMRNDSLNKCKLPLEAYISFTVNTKGKPYKITTAGTDCKSMIAEIFRVISMLEFTPAMENGVVIEQEMNMVYKSE